MDFRTQVEDQPNVDIFSRDDTCSSLSTSQDCNETTPADSVVNTSSDHDFNEPLGYQNFLCDVNIEYSLGGNCAHYPSNRLTFKMKCLPYMISDHFRKSSIASSDSSTSDCHAVQDDLMCNSPSVRPIDVTNISCAFLGNSDFVPTSKLSQRRVTLELIAAKLSQSVPPGIPARPSFSSLNEVRQTNSYKSSEPLNYTERYRTQSNQDYQHSQSRDASDLHHSPRQTQVAPSLTSKRFVNYTLLIKTTPGLDKQPAVIERRFSDFLDLYQGLRRRKSHERLVNQYVNFPKKIYMGNFSLSNIAERSIEFSKLLELCMTNEDILWSVPFISFLLDKELKEAHRLLLFSEPETVQAVIETVYHIIQKLYVDQIRSDISTNSSSISLNNLGDQNSPTSSSDRTSNIHSSGNDTISFEVEYPQNLDAANDVSNLQNRSEGGTSDGESTSCSRDSIVPLNQRILVTFCILFLAYHRGEQYSELKSAIESFSRMISSQDYLASVIGTHHYTTLRACLLFLMNVNREDVVDDNRRIWLKRKLEDVDAAFADINESSINTNGIYQDGRSLNNVNRQVARQRMFIGNTTLANRITKSDLTTLLTARNFCTFTNI